MRRERVSEYPKVKEFNPLLWKQCRFCKKEFKQEKGFKIIEESSKIVGLKVDEVSYCCSSCGVDIEHIVRAINMRNFFNSIRPPR